MAEFEVVQRPRGGGNVPDALIDALKKTLNTSNAVRLKLDGHANFINWQATVRGRLRQDHRLRLRTKFNKSSCQVTAWVEEFDDRTGTDLSEAGLGVSADNA